MDGEKKMSDKKICWNCDDTAGLLNSRPKGVSPEGGQGEAPEVLQEAAKEEDGAGYHFFRR